MNQSTIIRVQLTPESEVYQERDFYLCLILVKKHWFLLCARKRINRVRPSCAKREIAQTDLAQFLAQFTELRDLSRNFVQNLAV